MADHYVWLVWASAFLLPWLALFAGLPRYRRAMFWSSVFTMPMGLTEPLFVQEYWSPPSLFDLAVRTGFDIESLVFSFGIGGVGAVLYSVLRGEAYQPLPDAEHHAHRHRYHTLALVSPFLCFPLLYFFPWNPIYPAIAAMAVGAAATMACRPDLKTKTWLGGVLFLAYYTAFLQALRWSAPGYIERVWNLGALTGVALAGMPLEELLFAVGFGMYWSGVYEHFTWRTSARMPVRTVSTGDTPAHA